MTIKTFHIFKAGAHTAMGGTEFKFSQQELQETAAAFSEAVRPAPLVLGHPTHDSPAMGWVRSLNANSAGLFATADFGAGLVSEVKAKRYPNVSAAFLSKDDPRNPTPGRWYLRHVGFLGAVAPAIKGLEPVTFAEFSWDGATTAPLAASAFNIAREIDVAFAEVQTGGKAGEFTESQERQIQHTLMQRLMKSTPGMSAATAANTAFRAVEEHKAMKSQATSMDADRVAFHEKILDLQAVTPGLPYAAAAHRLMNSR